VSRDMFVPITWLAEGPMMLWVGTHVTYREVVKDLEIKFLLSSNQW